VDFFGSLVSAKKYFAEKELFLIVSIVGVF